MFPVPSGPWTNVGIFSINNVEVPLVFLFPFELLLGSTGSEGINGGEPVFTGLIQGADECGGIWVNGGIGRVTENGMSKASANPGICHSIHSIHRSHRESIV